MVKNQQLFRFMFRFMVGIMILFVGQTGMANTLPQPSGEIVNGFRVLKVQGLDYEPLWVIYRGDYIKFDIGTPVKDKTGKNKIGKDPILTIPSLSIEKKLSPELDKTPYFKMKKIGVFDFSIGSLVGTLKVVEYNQINYQAVSAQKALEVIDSFDPMILDVRTPREYSRGHLENSVLIPVQRLQSRLGDLSAFKDEPILIYCATGNRSTVASKILIDSGFTRIFNLRSGIADWIRKKYPIVQ
jgi:rhodanese-related sulfurtransferase